MPAHYLKQQVDRRCGTGIRGERRRCSAAKGRLVTDIGAAKLLRA
jgi:hypothetical protein